MNFYSPDFQNQTILSGLLGDPTDTAYITTLVLSAVNPCLLYINSTFTGEGTGVGPELSSSFETGGQIYVRVTEDIQGVLATPVEITVNGPDAPGSISSDDDEPYVWRPANIADLTQFYADLGANFPFLGFVGTLILRDYTLPLSGTINLSASGPDEFAGVTDSATVTVT